MRILVTGSHGMLGGALLEAAACRGWGSRTFDRAGMAQSGAVESALSGVDCLVHAAANTNVEYCEVHPEECYRDNTQLTETLAGAAARARVPMVFVSSTGVYGSHRDTPYDEYDETHPTTHHHRSKLMGEQAVMAVPGNLVVRSGWLFGGDTANPKNFVARRIEEAAKSGGVIRSNDRQRGCPTYCMDLAERILEMIGQRTAGIFNCVNEGHASRLEYVSEIVKLSGLPVSVEPVGADAFQRKAKVSDNEMAVNRKMREAGFAAMRSWQQALADYLSQLEVGRLVKG